MSAIGFICERAEDMIAGRRASAWLEESLRSSRLLSRVGRVSYDRWQLDALDDLRAKGESPDYVVVCFSSAPLTIGEDLDAAIELAREHQLDRVVSAAPVEGTLWRRDSAGAVPENVLEEIAAFHVLPTARLGSSDVATKLRASEIPRERAATLDDAAGRAVCAAVLTDRKRRDHLQRLPAKVQAIVFDFDGVFTDNQVLTDSDGREAVSCSRSDAFGLAECRVLGIPMIVMSTEANRVVEARCAKLKLPFIQGLADKGARLAAWLDEKGFDAANVVYVGNDINDLGCLRLVGCAVVPADAHPAVLDDAAIILDHRGGHGAVREIAELVARHVRESR